MPTFWRHILSPSSALKMESLVIQNVGIDGTKIQNIINITSMNIYRLKFNLILAPPVNTKQKALLLNHTSK